MLGYKINPADIKLIEKVNFLKEEYTETVCNIYMNVYTTYGTEEYYLVGRIFKDYKAQGCYTYIDGIEKEYKTVKPVLNAIMKQYNCGVSYDKVLEYTGLKKDIKETRLYKKLVAEELKKTNTIEVVETNEVIEKVEEQTPVTETIETIKETTAPETLTKYFVYAHYFNTIEEAQEYCNTSDFDYNMIEKVEVEKTSTNSNINDNIKLDNNTTTIIKTTPEPLQSIIIPNQSIIYTYKNISIYAELEPYTSNLTKQSYNCIRDITITKDNNIIYKTYNIYFPLDVKNLDLIDFINYQEYICKFILSQEAQNIDFYWTNMQLDKLIREKNTFKFDMIIRDIKKVELEQLKNIEYENNQNSINNLITELETICTAKQIILYRDYTNIIIIDNLEYYNKKDTILSILKSFMDSNKDTKEDYNKWFAPFEVSNISLYDSNTLEQLTNTKALLSNYKHTTSKAV